MTYPKRLIEVDLPIKRISAHARREKLIRHGHISTLHIWWARRPLAACRAVICASLWIDPVDALCPQVFRDQAVKIITKFAKKGATDKDLANHCSPENWSKWKALAKPENTLDPQDPKDLNRLRDLLLDFIADFANWDNSTQSDYLETARALTQAAHEALGGEVGSRPLVVDPFAGGGSIPLEALRVGADTFASDLNPVAVLLNKVVLEYIPKYGQCLADEVRKWGQWVKEETEKELAEFYPKDEDGSTPIAYLWARTIISEAPDDGTGIPVEVPLMRSLWLAKKAGRNKALRWVRDARGMVQTETVDVAYADGLTRKVRRPLLEIFEPKNEKEVEKGTVAKGTATCPVSGYTTLVSSVRKQIKSRLGGTHDARLICIVRVKTDKQGRFYKLPDIREYQALEKIENKMVNMDSYCIPCEKFSGLEPRRIPLPIYGILGFENLFSKRQMFSCIVITKILQKLSNKFDKNYENDLQSAIRLCLALVVDKVIQYNSSLCRWKPTGEYLVDTFGRQALPMVWDFAEANIIGGASGDLGGMTGWVVEMIHKTSLAVPKESTSSVTHASAMEHPLANKMVDVLATDPPYYYSIPYSDLSDYFYVWLKRSIGDLYPKLFETNVAPKDGECIQNLPHSEVAHIQKDRIYYEQSMLTALSESRRITKSNAIGTVVFAHTDTAAWESLLSALINAGWYVTASWSIDTEMTSRILAKRQSTLASSVHLVCRPRENPDGTLHEEIGDWRDVLQELPQRIKEWMPRLTEQGVVGADAIFACLGPALEIFSRYSSVEKASGEIVPLREYLEYVWAAISKEALSTIFKDADTSSFEEDARLTAMWLWTLSAGDTETGKTTALDEEDISDDDDESTGKKAKVTGFSLEYDAARKIAQGLGAHLETLTHLVEVKGDKARLLPVKERAAYLFGKEGIIADIPKRKSQGNKQLTITGIFDEIPEDEYGGIKITRIGETVCDKVHQAMLLFNSGRSEALKRFLVDEAIGKDAKFWQLAQSFSALYPAGTDEKRWVDGLLARKKGLGL